MTEPSEANYVWNKDIQFAPVRSLSEFLTDTTRYEVCISDISKSIQESSRSFQVHWSVSSYFLES